MRAAGKKFLGICFLSLISLPSFANISINLNYLAQSGQAMPGLKETYLSFQPPSMSYGHLVYGAKGSLGSIALYSNLFGPISIIASNYTAVPGSTGNFTSFTTMVDFSTPIPNIASISSGKIAFLGTDPNFNSGLYSSASPSQISIIANSNTPAPGTQGLFSNFSHPHALSDGSIGFIASTTDGDKGIFYSNSKGILSKLVDISSSIPNGQGTFQNFRELNFSNTPSNLTTFAFVGTGSLKQVGLYVMQDNKLSMVANQNTSMPGNHVGLFSDFGSISYDAANHQIAFVGKGILGQQAIFLYNGQNITPIVSQQNLIPGGNGQFNSFATLNLQGDNLVFSATGNNNQQGIYLYQLGTASTFKVISNQDSIQGKKIKNIFLSKQALNQNQLAMLVQFTDGSSGIFIAAISGTYN